MESTEISADAQFAIEGHRLDPKSVRLLPHVFCITNNVVILGTIDRTSTEPIRLGMVNPNRVDVIDLVSMKFDRRRVEPVPMEHQSMLRAINQGFGFGKIVPEDSRQKTREEEEKEKEASFELADSVRTLDGLEPVDQSQQVDKPIIDVVNTLLLDALRRGATDIHIESERKLVQVRFKIDGMLYKVSSGVHKDNINEVISRIKIMAELDISEHRAPQDGRILFRTLRDGTDYDVPFRISILPGPYGEEVVLRILDKSMAPINLELLGFTSRDLKLYRSLIKNPQGMILVTGPTGAGKTTTLYATLKEINTPYNKILSVEDPIEYNLEGVNQKQITTKFGFADMARAFLRHDPDIVLIGEIRDEATADVACKAAQTGHLILSTIHTNDSISTLGRMASLGINPNMIASTLLGALSQRLVRRICPHCRQKYSPEESILKLLGDHLKLETFTHGVGCPKCNNTGFQSRIGIFELFYIDDEIQDMIEKGAAMSEIMNQALLRGMVPLTMDGIYKIEQGLTTVEELFRVVPRRQIMAQLQKRFEEIE